MTVFQVGTQRIGDITAYLVAALVGQFNQRIFQTVDHVGVIACAARQGVGKCIAGQHVVPGVALDVERPVTVHGDVFKVAQRAAVQIDEGVALHAVIEDQRVIAFVRIFFGQVQFAGLVDDIGIVTGAADQGIQARQAIEYVITGVAGQNVVKAVTRGVDVATAEEFEVFQIVAQAPAYRGAHSVDLAGQGAALENDVAGVVDHIDVVTGPANQRVGATITVEQVIAGITGDDVFSVVAIAIDAGIGQQCEVFDVGVDVEAIAGRGENRIDLTGRGTGFVDPVIPVVDVVGVVAGTAVHRVDTCATVENVVQVVAAQDVVEIRTDGIFDLGAIGDAQAAVEDRATGEIGQPDGAVGAFIEVDIDLRGLRAGIDRVVAASVPDGFEDRFVSFPLVDVVASLPTHVGAVQRLYGEDVQHHRRHGLIGVGVVVAHDRELDVVQCRVEDRRVPQGSGKWMLEAQCMTYFVDEGHVVISTLGGVLGSRITDPYVTAARDTGGGVRPGSCLVAHQAITTEPQIANVGDIVGSLGKGDVGDGAPGGQRIDDAAFLTVGQLVDGVVFVIGTVVGGEVRSAWFDKAVGQLGRAIEWPIHACPIGS